MANDFDEFDELNEDDDQAEIEAYCMSCREKTPMDNPTPIWTRRGSPGTRGTCSICGTTTFLMGATDAHRSLKRPEPVQVTEQPRGKRGTARAAANVTYLNYSVKDEEFAEILAEDLNRIGIKTWLPGSEVEEVNWATGVHPALVECNSMIVILTALGVKQTNVAEALDFFAKSGKTIVVAQLEATDVPDIVRRKPRFDFSGDDYKQQFRALVQALTGS